MSTGSEFHVVEMIVQLHGAPHDWTVISVIHRLIMIVGLDDDRHDMLSSPQWTVWSE